MVVRGLRLAIGLVVLSVPTPALSQSPNAGFLSQFIAPDARSAAMGGAFTAIAEGPNATWWNPGALAFGKPVAVMPFSYTNPFPLLELTGADHWKTSFGVVGHRNAVGVGAHYDHFHARADSPGGEQSWSEQFVRLGAGVDVVPLLAGEDSAVRFGVGASAKLLRASFEGVTGTSGLPTGDVSNSVIDLDLGGLFVYTVDVPRPRPRERTGRASYLSFRSGIVARNVLDRKVKGLDDGDGTPIGGGLAASLAMECALLDFSQVGYVLRGQVSYEEEWHRDYDRTEGESGFLEYLDPIHHFGFETLFLETLAIRVGHIDDSRLDIHDWSWGFGVGTEMFRPPEERRFGLAFDYADLPGHFVGGDERVSHYGVSGWLAL